MKKAAFTYGHLAVADAAGSSTDPRLGGAMLAGGAVGYASGGDKEKSRRNAVVGALGGAAAYHGGLALSNHLKQAYSLGQFANHSAQVADKAALGAGALSRVHEARTNPRAAAIQSVGGAALGLAGAVVRGEHKDKGTGKVRAKHLLTRAGRGAAMGVAGQGMEEAIRTIPHALQKISSLGAAITGLSHLSRGAGAASGLAGMKHQYDHAESKDEKRSILRQGVAGAAVAGAGLAGARGLGAKGGRFDAAASLAEGAASGPGMAGIGTAMRLHDARKHWRNERKNKG